MTVTRCGNGVLTVKFDQGEVELEKRQGKLFIKVPRGWKKNADGQVVGIFDRAQVLRMSFTEEANFFDSTVMTKLNSGKVRTTKMSDLMRYG